MSWNCQNLSPFGANVNFAHAENIQLFNSHQIEELIRAHDLLLLRGAMNPSREEFLDFCTSLPGFSSEPLSWDFGPVMELKVERHAQNYLFSRERVPFHWDGAFHKEPAVLAFHCLEAPSVSSGGQTIFTNTTRLFQDLSPYQQELCAAIELEYRTEKLAHYGGVIRRPLLQNHPVTGKKILRFAEEVRTELNPVQLFIHGVSADVGRQLLGDLTQMAYDSAYCYCHQWQSGDLLFADNFSLIHGRHAFKESSPRWIRRVQILHPE